MDMSLVALVFQSCVFRVLQLCWSMVDKDVTRQYAAGGDDSDTWCSLPKTEIHIDVECIKQKKPER